METNRPEGWSTVQEPGSNTRYWVRAVDPLEVVADMIDSDATHFVRRGDLTSGEVAAAQVVEPPIVALEDN